MSSTTKSIFVVYQIYRNDIFDEHEYVMIWKNSLLDTFDTLSKIFGEKCSCFECELENSDNCHNFPISIEELCQDGTRLHRWNFKNLEEFRFENERRRIYVKSGNKK